MTIGDDLNTVARFLAPGRESYTAAEVVEQLLGQSVRPQVEQEQLPQVVNA